MIEVDICSDVIRSLRQNKQNEYPSNFYEYINHHILVYHYI